MAHTGSCDLCGTLTTVESIELSKNTGMLIMRQSSTLSGDLCRTCGQSEFINATLHNLVLGWWGLVSFFVNIYFLFNNAFYFVKILQLPAPVAKKGNRLDEHSDYARNMLATKDEEIVIEVLMSDSGASREEVVRFIRGL